MIPSESNIPEAKESGDEAERIAEEYAPYLRMVVRRRMNESLRQKFDSEDLVQSVWAHLMDGVRNGEWDFESPHQLQAFLKRVTNNRLTDRMRRIRRELEQETATDAEVLDRHPANDETASQAVYAEELWDRLITLCPKQHRGILELRREGLTLGEISNRLGMHESSIRRVLYDLARELSRGRA